MQVAGPGSRPYPFREESGTGLCQRRARRPRRRRAERATEHLQATAQSETMTRVRARCRAPRRRQPVSKVSRLRAGGRPRPKAAFARGPVQGPVRGPLIGVYSTHPGVPRRRRAQQAPSAPSVLQLPFKADCPRAGTIRGLHRTRRIGTCGPTWRGGRSRKAEGRPGPDSEAGREPAT